jgi:uncharacterized repeat protein (TIGR01451 family)
MRSSFKKYSVTAAVVIFALLLASIPTLVFASRGLYAPLPPAITPEPYPNSEFYPAIVFLSTSNDLQVLYRMNIDIDGLQPVNGASGVPAIFTPSNATVYINPAQAIALSQAGLTPIPTQNEGYRSFLAYGPGSGAPNAWPTFDEYVSRMQNLEAAYPDIVKLEVIGYSVQGRGLYCMEITDNPGVSENEPEFKYTANHHGDETTGIEMTMRLAELLANGYGSDPLLTDLVDKMEIWLCPIYNPDGYVNGTRYNAHGQDLNRDFPDRFTDPIDDPAGREPETQAFMYFGYAHRFVMGANYHTGEQVSNYPWDAIADPDHPEYAPDDQLFYNLGLGYTSRNPDLWNNPDFENGITRGWQWYMIYGGMQDWAYNYRGEHHVTLEISFTKSPPFNQMDSYWEHNREAMLWWMQQALTGLGGEVLDARDSTPLDATLTLVGRDVPNTILTDPEIGDYHRVISPGSYTLDVNADGYLDQSANVTVYSGTVTTHDFYICPTDTWTVSGTVTDSATGSPLQASIEFIGSRQVTMSDPENGHYSLEICPSAYTMKVSAMWYYPEERQVSIDHDQIQDFALNPTPNLSLSTKSASIDQALPGDLVQYQLSVVNLGENSLVLVTDTLPAEVTWTGELTATQGTPSFNAGRILWQGEVALNQPVTITYAISVNQCLAAGLSLLNIAEFNDGVNGIITGKVDLPVDNAPPSLPDSPSPIDGALNQPITTTLAWAPSTDLNCDAITYDLAFGTSPTPEIVASELTNPIYDPGLLLPATTYYWQVTAHDGLTDITGAIWSFITFPKQQKIFLPLSIK